MICAINPRFTYFAANVSLQHQQSQQCHAVNINDARIIPVSIIHNNKTMNLSMPVVLAIPRISHNARYCSVFIQYATHPSLAFPFVARTDLWPRLPRPVHTPKCRGCVSAASQISRSVIQITIRRVLRRESNARSIRFVSHRRRSTRVHGDHDDAGSTVVQLVHQRHEAKKLDVIWTVALSLRINITHSRRTTVSDHTQHNQETSPACDYDVNIIIIIIILLFI